jgi:hypothetical protein
MALSATGHVPLEQAAEAAASAYMAAIEARPQPGASDDEAAGNGQNLRIVTKRAGYAKCWDLGADLASRYAGAYLNLATAMGDALATGNWEALRAAPMAAEDYAGRQAPPFALRLESPKAGDRAHLTGLAEGLAKVLQAALQLDKVQVYAGFAPRDPEGGAGGTAYAWAPECMVGPGIRPLLQKSLRAWAEREAPEELLGAAKKEFLAEALAGAVEDLGTGAVPWCRDPGSANQEYPVIPCDLVAVAQGGAVSIKNLASSHALGGSAWLGEVNVVVSGGWSCGRGDPPLLAKAMGYRAPGRKRSQYDVFGLVVAAGYGRQDPPPPPPDAEAQGGGLFDNARPLPTGALRAGALLDLLAPRRFNAGTDTGISGACEILQALAQDLEETEPSCESYRERGLELMGAAAAVQGVAFDAPRVGAFHAQNYGDKARRYRNGRVLHYLARADSYEEYGALLGSRIWKTLERMCGSKDDVPLAEACCTYMAATFHWSAPGDDPREEGRATGTLSRFDGRYYRRISGAAAYVAQMFSEEETGGALNKMLRDALQRCARDGARSAGMAGTLEDVLRKLRESRYRRAVAAVIIETLPHVQKELYGNGPECLMNEDPGLTGVRNGVLEVFSIPDAYRPQYDGHRRKIIYREATPADYFSVRMNAAYRPELGESADMKVVRDYFAQYFPAPRTRTWVLCQLAMTLFLDTNNKVITFFVGPSDCGKTTFLYHALRLIFKDAVEQLPSNCLSDPKIGQDVPQAPLYRAARGRAAYAEEMTARIRNTAAKVLAGGPDSTLVVRTLNKGGGTRPFGANIFICANQNPRVDLVEPAILNRFAIIPFKVRFVAPNAPALPATAAGRRAKKVYPIDSSVGDRFAQCLDAYLLYLIKHFDAWTVPTPDGGTKCADLTSFPAEIKMAGEAMVNESPITRFFYRHVTQASIDSVISFGRAWSLYRKSVHETEKLISKHEFEMGMGDLVSSGLKTIATIKPSTDSTYSQRGWRGWAMVTDSGEAQDEEEGTTVYHRKAPEDGEEEEEGGEGGGGDGDDDDEEPVGYLSGGAVYRPNAPNDEEVADAAGI